MGKAKTRIILTGIFLLLFSCGNISGNTDNPGGSYSDQTTSKSVHTKTKTTQTKPKPAQKSTKSEPEKKSKDSGTIRIGSQTWAVANLNVNTFRNGDTIPEASTNKEWVAAGESGKPAWCYYNNDPANGPKFGKLYNWYAVNDPRGLAPVGWTLSGDADWTKLINSLGGPGQRLAEN